MILIFSGTKDGRAIVEKVLNLGYKVIVSTATAYGSDLIENHVNLKKIHGQLNTSKIVTIINQESVSTIIDATHPYALQISENIIEAVSLTQIKCIRYERPSINDQYIQEFSTFNSMSSYLNSKLGNILLTIGANNLSEITDRVDKKRIYARILPLISSITKANNSGLKPSQIIAIQGVGSIELNSALLKNYNIKYLVTKDSGNEGGIREKLSAAKMNNVEVLLLARPSIEYQNEVSKIADLLIMLKG